MSSGIQIAVEQARIVYEEGVSRALLAQLCEIHRISIRDFAGIMRISKSHAEEVINHKKLPSLELAIRISRYFEVTTDELFGWRVDDDGSRRPLIVALPGGEVLRINNKNVADDPISIVKAVADSFRGTREGG